MRKLLCLILTLFLLAAAGCSTQAAAPTVAATPSQTPEPTWAPEKTAAEKTAATTAEATATSVPAATPAVSDFATKEVNLANVEAALKGFFMEGEYVGTDVENSGGVMYVTITYRPSTVTNENDFAVQIGFQASRVMEVLFQNKSVDVVTVKGDTATAEDMMEISMSKDTAATVDWAALIFQAQTDYKAILALADSHHIDGSISDKLK